MVIRKRMPGLGVKAARQRRGSMERSFIRRLVSAVARPVRVRLAKPIPSGLERLARRVGGPDGLLKGY